MTSPRKIEANRRNARASTGSSVGFGMEIAAAEAPTSLTLRERICVERSGVSRDEISAIHDFLG